jgi:gluconolactonase
MRRDPTILVATPFTRLPAAMRHSGEPSRWAKMTRPGQSMHSFIEGAFFTDDGTLWLTDVPYGRIFRVDPDGNWRVTHQYEGEPHSMRFDTDGRPMITDYSLGLIKLEGTNTVETIAGSRDQEFMGLSDMCFAPDGSLWFTDSGRTSISDPSGRVYVRRTDGQIRLVLSNVPYSNGIAASQDGEQIYLSATRANQIWRFSATLPDEGPPMVGVFQQLSGGLGPDGLAVNALGWLAVAQAQAGRAYVFDALGDPLAVVHLPEGLWTTSVAFNPVSPKRLIVTEAQYGVVYAADIPDVAKEH